MNKAIEHEQIFSQLDFMAQMIPAPFYWIGIDGKALGVNQKGLEAIGAPNKKYIIGKTLHQIYNNKEVADKLQQDIDEVIRTGKSSQQEESIIDITSGRLRYYAAVRSPLFDYDHNIIGVIGTSIEITAQKEAEFLELENQAHKIRAEDDEKFRNRVGKMVHDIGAPVSSIIALAKTAESLPDMQRVALRNAGLRIHDLSNNLLAQYKPNWDTTPTERCKMLVSDAINQILSEKRLQYYESLINFETYFSQNSHFVFINIDAYAFKRTLSNLINNSVDAFDGQAGIVTVKLECDANSVYIIIKDNGKGIRPELVNKIINNVNVTEGKKDGHGLGLSQVRETLQLNDGKFKINSNVGVGTEIILTFPKATTPSWIADNIKIYADDIVVILDDDSSIHTAWDSRFAANAPKLSSRLNHFESAQATIDFINNLPIDDKKNVFLLVDYELLHQKLTGLDVVEQTGITRSILVTSHNENLDIQAEAYKTHTKILPKLLVAEIPISVVNVEDNPQNSGELRSYQKQVDMVVIDDNVMLTDTLGSTIFKNKKVDIYNDLQIFFANVKQYTKGTKFLIDNNYDNYNGELREIRTLGAGFDLAKLLHEDGFTELYLFSGDTFKNIPDYLRVINKGDIDKIEALIATDFEKHEKLDLGQQLWNITENFNKLNSHATGYNTFYEITDTVYEIKKKPAKIAAYLDKIEKIGESVRDDLQYEVSTISKARRMFNKEATQENDLLECDFESNLIDSKLKFALNEKQSILNQDIKRTFKYMGNIIIIDMILLNLFKYSATQIQQSNRGKIDISINKHGRNNKFFLKYSAPGVKATTPENDSHYAKNYEFCKNAMHLFGGSLTTNILIDNSVEFILSFPKIQKGLVAT